MMKCHEEKNFKIMFQVCITTFSTKNSFKRKDTKANKENLSLKKKIFAMLKDQ